MSYKDEIKELQQALLASPDNNYIRLLLVKKYAAYPEYDQELESEIQKGLRINPNEHVFKNYLMQVYFRQMKVSACIIIGEELNELDALFLDSKIILAKCYLRENDLHKSQILYQRVLVENNQFEDQELDAAFRMKTQHDDTSMNNDSQLFTKPEIGFKEVGGMEKVKREIDLKIIKPMENAELYASYGKKAGGGILLYGPPGCGKTFIAKATAGEINANFINISLNDILDMWLGQSEKNLNKYFEIARDRKPCVLFFDEVDALGAKRTDMKNSAGKNVINQFLAELDGIHSNNDGILVIGATNMPWHLDPAFRRPGRFDRIIFVPPPDEESKKAILKLKLEGKPQENIDFAKIAKKTKDYSGADLNAIIDIAIEKILEDAMETGVPKPITTKDLIYGTTQHKASTLDWFSTAKNYAMFANKTGLYDDILKYLK